MKKQEELAVITKTYDLILWSCNHTGRFPRQHRFVLGERLERTLYDLLETLIQVVVPCRTSLFRSAKSTIGPAGLVGRKTRTPCRAIVLCSFVCGLLNSATACPLLSCGVSGRWHCNVNRGRFDQPTNNGHWPNS